MWNIPYLCGMVVSHHVIYIGVILRVFRVVDRGITIYVNDIDSSDKLK